MAKHGVEFVTAEQSAGSISADGRFLGLTTDREANLRAIAAGGPLEYLFGQGVSVPDEAQAALRGILLDSLRDNLSGRFETDVVRAIPAVIRADEAGEIEGSRWTDDVKNAFADRVLNLLERHAPGFQKLILARTVHSPNDLEGLNPNLVGGDLNAGSMHLSQFYGRRPVLDGSREPMPGLFMCGASTWPGGGANPGSGVLLAQQLLES